MIRYRLDDLGWFQFEWLVQSLLKAECGLTVESWGDHGDWGRDAWSNEALHFPSFELNAGPFVFQIKFVQEANAAGSRSDSLLVDTVHKEISRIHKRVKQNKWVKPNYYVFITNAQISANIRPKIHEILNKAELSLKNVIMGGNDICDLVDKHESLTRLLQ